MTTGRCEKGVFLCCKWMGTQSPPPGGVMKTLDLVRRKRFDLILVDLYMTPISGMEVLKAAVEAHKQVIVVVMTGNPTVASSIEALRAGAWDYLPKPFSASHLQVLIGRAAHAVATTRTCGNLCVPPDWSPRAEPASSCRCWGYPRRSGRPWNWRRKWPQRTPR